MNFKQKLVNIDQTKFLDGIGLVLSYFKHKEPIIQKIYFSFCW